MIELTDSQFLELQEVLGHDPRVDGEWACVPDNGPCKFVINSKGTLLIRLACKDKRGANLPARINSFSEDKGHYLQCSMNNQEFKLHRLMASVWLPDFDATLTVNHIDGNKQNNDYHNLEMLTSAENFYHYQNSTVFKEQRTSDFKHHRDTIRGRIHITNGIESHMIYPDDDIPDGWYRGRPDSMKNKLSQSVMGRKSYKAGKICITDGHTLKFIYPDEAIPAGWRRGSNYKVSDERLQNMSEDMKKRIYITKDKINKRVYEEELSNYLAQGWRKGMYSKRWDNV